MSAEYFKPKLDAHIENDFEYIKLLKKVFFSDSNASLINMRKFYTFSLHLSIKTEIISRVLILSRATSNLNKSMLP